MEITNEELRVAFEEMKFKMGLLQEDLKTSKLSPFLVNFEYPRSKLISFILEAEKILIPADRFSPDTAAIIKYLKETETDIKLKRETDVHN